MSKITELLGWNELPAELISSLIVATVMIVLALVIFIKTRHVNPLDKPRGIVHLAEICVSFADKEVKEIMGPAFEGFGSYVLALALFILFGFVFGMIGLPNIFQPYSDEFLQPLPNPFTNVASTLALALCTFTLVHFTAIRVNHWGYFKRYVKPFAVFLPINLVTMWSPVLSLTLRLFGNALAGYFVITLIYVGFSGLFDSTMAGLAFTPLLSPFAHLYFDIFDGLIQMTVFVMLTMLYVSQEYISPEDLAAAKRDKALLKEQKAQLKAQRHKKNEALKI